MKVFTPPMTAGCDVTSNRCNNPGIGAASRRLLCAASAFHSSADFGCAFHICGGGAPISTCAAGLAVLGTGMSRAGSWRVPGESANAEPNAIRVNAKDSGRAPNIRLLLIGKRAPTRADRRTRDERAVKLAHRPLIFALTH